MQQGIRNVQRLTAAQQEPDLTALVEPAVYRHALSIRNQPSPPACASCGRLVRVNRAEAIFRTITDPPPGPFQRGILRRWQSRLYLASGRKAGSNPATPGPDRVRHAAAGSPVRLLV